MLHSISRFLRPGASCLFFTFWVKMFKCPCFRKHKHRRLSFVRDVFTFKASHSVIAPALLMILPEKQTTHSVTPQKKTHRLVLWVSPPRFSSESAVFTFNASLKDVAPSSLIVFTGEQNTNCEEKSMMEYLLCALFILSFVSVAFIFNASNNDSAPFGSIQLSD